jgi:hypothetical protein
MSTNTQKVSVEKQDIEKTLTTPPKEPEQISQEVANSDDTEMLEEKLPSSAKFNGQAANLDTQEPSQ